MKMPRHCVRALAHRGCARLVFFSTLALQASGCAEQATDEEVARQSQALVDTALCPSGTNIIIGTESDDHLVGTNKADCIVGLSGNDTIEGGNGDDWVLGGDGDDRLDGDNGQDHLDGGSGNDSLGGGNDSDVIEGGEGDDVLSGDNGADTLRGGQGNDSFAGGNGEDDIQGDQGNDFLAGDNGGDGLHGGSGNDTLMGGNGDDILDGDEGDDVLVGENGADTADGQTGNDILVGGNGTDVLLGGLGNDVIVGGKANDRVEGGDGLDVCDQACCEAIIAEQPNCYTDADCQAGLYCVPEAGLCVACSADAACVDATSCTTDACQPALGCLHLPVPNGTLCDDGNACLQTDSCVDGTCRGSNPVQCAAQDQCHSAGSCDPATGSCNHPPIEDGTACNDGNACTQTDACVKGSCNGTNPVVCAALDQCHDVGMCDPSTGGCSNPPSVDGTTCNDGDACSIGDTCNAGSCAPGAPLDCDDQNSCSDDTCHGGTCQHLGNGSCLVPKTFTESGGLVIIEAENYNLNTPRSDHSWDTTEDPLASGGSMMRAVPNSGTLLNEDVLSACPQLDFNVNFTTAGKYYVWVRGKADSTLDDTCHVGLDGTIGSGTSRIFVSGNAYAWGRTNTSNAIASVTVATVGMHSINFWMREDGFKFDKILLTTDASYKPTGTGPTPTAVAGCAGLGGTFPGNPEICDGFDQNCDGVADFPGEAADSDRDGFLACAECDDDDSRRFPGNTEVCDGLDNDCDGVASYPNEATDADQDGSPACSDCNEYDLHNFPGNREACDGRDNDCNGRADADLAGEVDADGDAILSCIDCNDHDTNNAAKVNFLVHGPAAEATSAPAQIRLVATQPLGALWLPTAAQLTWSTQVTLPHHTNVAYQYMRNDSPDSTEVGPLGEVLQARKLTVECSDLVVEDAIWNWDDLTSTGQVALEKGPTVSTLGDASNQITISVDLNTPPDPPMDATLHFSSVSNDYLPENILVGSGTSRYEFSLTGLQPGTTYFYYVEYGGQVTSEYHFTTSSGSDQRFRFAAYGDSQDQSGTNVHRDIVSQAYAYHPSVVIRTGDLTDAGADANRWQSFFAIERPLLSSALYLPVRGNHESYNASFTTTTPTNFFNYFALPTTSGTEEYYAVRYNNTLFIGLSTEATIAGTQTSWLSNTLDSANSDPSIRWKVAYFHRPPYSKGEHGSDPTVRSNWHELFRDKGVKLVFSGHDHDYERAVVDGVQYLVIGGAGSDLRDVGSDPTRTIYSESVFHWVAVEVDGPQLSATAFRVDGSRMDRFTLQSPSP